MESKKGGESVGELRAQLAVLTDKFVADNVDFDGDNNGFVRGRAYKRKASGDRKLSITERVKSFRLAPDESSTARDVAGYLMRYGIYRTAREQIYNDSGYLHNLMLIEATAPDNITGLVMSPREGESSLYYLRVTNLNPGSSWTSQGPEFIYLHEGVMLYTERGGSPDFAREDIEAGSEEFDEKVAIHQMINWLDGDEYHRG